MKKSYFIICLLFAAWGTINGQGIQDALRYSQFNYLASARSAAMGGAFGGIGADFGSLAVNPAGVAVYRSNEFSFSISTNKTFAGAELQGAGNGVSSSESRRRLKIDHAGLVFYGNPGGSDWSTSNFAFGLHRLANFDQHIFYQGETAGSYTERFLDRANGRDLDGLDNFEGGLAYDVGAIWGPDSQLEYFSDYQANPNEALRKDQDIVSRGGMYEMNFSYGANYKELFLFGLSVGIPFVNFNEDKTYNEEAINPSSVLKKLEFDQYLSASGIGFNAKAGFIAVVGKVFRIGASAHTPTYFSLNEDYFNEMHYEYDEGTGIQSNTDGSPDGKFDYKFVSPWRFTGSLGAIFQTGDLGFVLDLDAEYVDYTNGRFNFTAYSNSVAEEQHEKEVNQDIRNEFKPAVSLRMGGELSFKKWRARAGYMLPGSPFVRDDALDVIPGYAAGVGFRSRSYYVDLSYVRQSVAYGYTPYELVDSDREQFVGIDKTNTKWILTIGTKF